MMEISKGVKNGDRFEFYIESPLNALDTYENEANVVRVHEEHQTFDEILIDVADCTDDEDEELVEARKNVKDNDDKDDNESVYYSSFDCGSLFSENDDDFEGFECKRLREKV